jgi:hypothetical protein
MTEQVIVEIVEEIEVVELTDAEIDAVGGGYGNIKPF